MDTKYDVKSRGDHVAIRELYEITNYEINNYFFHANSDKIEITL